MRRMRLHLRDGWIAQLVEQRIENPCVPSSNLGFGTITSPLMQYYQCFSRTHVVYHTIMGTFAFSVAYYPRGLRPNTPQHQKRGAAFLGSKQLCRCHSNTKRRQGLSPCVRLCAPIARPNTSRSCPIPIVPEFRYPTKAINTDTLQKTCDIVQYISDRIEKTGELDLFHGPSRPFFTYGEGQERY